MQSEKGEGAESSENPIEYTNEFYPYSCTQNLRTVRVRTRALPGFACCTPIHRWYTVRANLGTVREVLFQVSQFGVQPRKAANPVIMHARARYSTRISGTAVRVKLVQKKTVG